MNIILGTLLGLVLGSFVDCIANRSLTNKSFGGRSYCDNCQKTLSWYDLFPVFSYLFLRGKCRFCHKKISPESLITEIVMAGLIGLLFYLRIPANFLTLGIWDLLLVLIDIVLYSTIISTLVAVFITDYKTGYIPDRITYPAVIIVFWLLLLKTLYQIYLMYLGLKDAPLGQYLLPPYSTYFQNHALDMFVNNIGTNLLAAALIATFFGVLILGTRGRGMGGGDLKLGFFMGLALGFEKGVLAVFLAFILGSIIGIGLIVINRKNLKQTIPFGPFLTLGSLLAFFWGPQILSAYFGLFSGVSILDLLPF